MGIWATWQSHLAYKKAKLFFVINNEQHVALKNGCAILWAYWQKWGNGELKVR